MAPITNIEQLDLDKVYSYADYLTWKFQDRLELFKGKIFKMSPAPSRTHQVLVGKFHIALAKYFAIDKCQLFLSPFDVRIPNLKKKTPDKEVYTVVQPDLCIICDEEKLDERGCNGAPDLVIEILSPGNSKKEMGIKFNLYEEAGVKEYWIVEPTEKAIFVYYLHNDKLIGQRPLTTDDVIQSPLFPELSFDVAAVFE